MKQIPDHMKYDLAELIKATGKGGWLPEGGRVPVPSGL